MKKNKKYRKLEKKVKIFVKSFWDERELVRDSIGERLRSDEPLSIAMRYYLEKQYRMLSGRHIKEPIMLSKLLDQAKKESLEDNNKDK